MKHRNGQTENNQLEWGRIPDARNHFGLSRSKVYELMGEGLIKSSVIKAKGTRSGIRLINLQSIRELLEKNAQ